MVRIAEFVSKYFFAFAVLAVLYGLAEYLAKFALGREAFVLDWKITQYYVNYLDFGFTRRAFVGTLFKPLIAGFSLSPETVKALVVALDAVVYITIIVTLDRVLRAIFTPQDPRFMLSRTILILSPVALVQMPYDLGRFDHIGALALLLAGAALFKERAVLAGLLLALAVLVHEAFFVYSFPIIIVFCLSRMRNNGQISAALGPPLTAVVLVFLFRDTGVDLNQVLAPETALGQSAFIRGIVEIPGHFIWKDAVILGFYMLAPYYLLWRYYRANGVRPDRLFAASFSPLALFLMGSDYYRWTHLIFITVFAVFLMRSASGFSAIPLSRADKALVLVLMLPLGPIGIDYMGPIFRMVSGLAG